jgi:hypothetical protein
MYELFDSLIIEMFSAQERRTKRHRHYDRSLDIRHKVSMADGITTIRVRFFRVHLLGICLAHVSVTPS